MPKVNVQRSIDIKKPVSEVFNTLNNYDNWTAWSPWLITEREAKVKVADDKKSYEWEGDVVGAGQMKITKEVQDKEIHIDLTFLKPWKSHALTSLYFSENNGTTSVTWTMDTSLPFFMFWMKKMMEEMIGMDYERGLLMMKEYVEDGKVSSHLEMQGVSDFPAHNYIGIKRSTSIGGVKENMPGDYEKLMEFMMSNHKDSIAGNAFSIYHKWDLKNKVCEYTACVPVNDDVKPGAGMISGHHPGGKMFGCKHTGSYKYAGNAWSAMYGRKQAKKFKENKNVPPIEEYLNSPKDTPENELISVVRFGVK